MGILIKETRMQYEEGCPDREVVLREPTRLGRLLRLEPAARIEEPLSVALAILIKYSGPNRSGDARIPKQSIAK